jgi:hypothetical protein
MTGGSAADVITKLSAHSVADTVSNALTDALVA